MASQALVSQRFDPSDTLDELIPQIFPAGVVGHGSHRLRPDFEYLSCRDPFPCQHREGVSARVHRLRRHLSYDPLKDSRQQSQPRDQARPLTILTLDPCQDTCSSFEELFLLWGYQSFIAYEGRSATELLDRCHPDVLLMDVVLPDMDGIDLVQRVRQSRCCRPYIVCLSAWDDEACQIRAGNAGCDRFISKPMELPVLRELLSVANLLRR